MIYVTWLCNVVIRGNMIRHVLFASFFGVTLQVSPIPRRLVPSSRCSRTSNFPLSPKVSRHTFLSKERVYCSSRWQLTRSIVISVHCYLHWSFIGRESDTIGRERERERESLGNRFFSKVVLVFRLLFEYSSLALKRWMFFFMPVTLRLRSVYFSLHRSSVVLHRFSVTFMSPSLFLFRCVLPLSLVSLKFYLVLSK